MHPDTTISMIRSRSSSISMRGSPLFLNPFISSLIRIVHITSHLSDRDTRFSEKWSKKESVFK